MYRGVLGQVQGAVSFGVWRFGGFGGGGFGGPDAVGDAVSCSVTALLCRCGACVAFEMRLNVSFGNLRCQRTLQSFMALPNSPTQSKKFHCPMLG